METAREAIPANTLPTLLRPLSFAEILDLAIALYRRNFATLVGIAASVTIPLLVLQVIALVFFPANAFMNGSSALSAGDLSQFFIYYGISMFVGIISAIAVIYQMAATSIAISERYMGRPTSIRQAYAGALRRWFHLLVGAILFGLVNVLVVSIFLVPFIMTTVGMSYAGQDSRLAALTACLLPLACILIIPLVVLITYLDTRWTFWVQSIAIEGYSGPSGLRRSWRLVAGSIWRVLGTVFLLGVFIYVVTVVPTSAITFLSMLALGGSFVLMTVAQYVVSTIISTVVTPLSYIVLTILYYDLRVRKEGLDLQMRIQSSPASAAPSPIQGNA